MLTRLFKNKMLLESNKRIIFYDFETTGFNPFHCEIIEIGAIDNYGNQINILLKPSVFLEPKITELTGLTTEYLTNNGDEQEEGLNKFNQFLNKYDDIFKNNTYLIAHNNHSFDKLFLHYQFQKYNIQISQTNLKFLDTLRLAQLLLENRKSHSMYSLGLYFNIMNNNQHRALDDCLALKQIFNLLLHLSKVKYHTDDLDDIIHIIEFPFCYNIQNI
jgi:DNA polymerase-3 subunit alpha (Gram-positive type)